MHLPAKKSLGQNFLKSKKAITIMIGVSEIMPQDMVIEIGPGKGAITGPLLETGADILAFELDQRMIEFLEEKFSSEITNRKLKLYHQDILEADVKHITNGKSYKVVANIPYYITNLILRRFLSSDHQPSMMALLVQKEVAERVVSRDGKESILSLSVKLYGTPQVVMKVGRQYFSPIPRVDSAILAITNINRNHISDPEFERVYFEVIKTAFAQKRKQAIKNLQSLSSKEHWEEIFQNLGIETNVRAEDISFEQWLHIIDKYIN